MFILHFEGVDYYSEVYINGYLIKDHYGSNAGFQVDITNYLVEGENDLVVYCFDPSKDRSIPRGKQDWELEGHAIWYTRTTGIYKSVWLEQVDKNILKISLFELNLIDIALAMMLNFQSLMEL